MTNKTITLPRNLVEEVVQTCAFTLTEIAYQELRAALAEPTIGIDHETMRARYTDPEALGLSSGTGSTLRVVVADPVPPAGGDVETVATMYVAIPEDFQSFVCLGRPGDGGKFYKAEPLITLEDHRAHVTRLQAEVERLNKDNESFIVECVTRGNANVRLQSELTKAREVEFNIRQAIADRKSYLQDPELLQGNRGKYEHEVGLLKCFLSNQSAPAAKGEECVHDFRMFSGECHKCGADWIPGKEYAPAEKGEPVAFPGYPPVPEDRKLPADQPAPVAVSLPERKTVKAGLLSESNTHNQGWNACLDEFARLNPIKQ